MDESVLSCLCNMTQNICWPLESLDGAETAFSTPCQTVRERIRVCHKQKFYLIPSELYLYSVDFQYTSLKVSIRRLMLSEIEACLIFLEWFCIKMQKTPEKTGVFGNSDFWFIFMRTVISDLDMLLQTDLKQRKSKKLNLHCLANEKTTHLIFVGLIQAFASFQSFAEAATWKVRDRGW